MEPENTLQTKKKPEIIVFAGPNGSGKTTVTQYSKIIEPYINADDIKKVNNLNDIEAALLAEKMREQCVEDLHGFTFETVLSTDRNLKLLRKAKDKGYFIRCIYVLTSNPEINVLRVKSRAAFGGHDVPEEKIRTRYAKALNLIPDLVDICDVIHIYDNSKYPFRIFKKRKDQQFIWPNKYWDEEKITELVSRRHQ